MVDKALADWWIHGQVVDKLGGQVGSCTSGGQAKADSRINGKVVDKA